tara:strand:- start:82 stop:285 length:204 start_codon:yes stop_codon:yes gene_type:complete
MKTIKTTVENTQNWKRLPLGTLMRVHDKDARKLVDNNEATYASKAEWKELRDKQKQETNKEKDNANN